MRPKILIIAGSDSCAGAGIQADIKTVSALGGYGMTAITAITAQNTAGIKSIHTIPAKYVNDQIDVVMQDIGADAVKTGMLYTKNTIEVVAAAIKKYSIQNLVVDPVIFATDGTPLIEENAIETLVEKLFPKSVMVTPNIPETEQLTKIKITSQKDMIRAGKKLLETGTQSVLIKGGHGTKENIKDILITKKGCKEYTLKRILSVSAHGTGCTLASGIACLLAKKKTIEESVLEAKIFVYNAIKNAQNLGKGNGQLDHTIQKCETIEQLTYTYIK